MKQIVISDLHFGRAGDSEQHCQDMIDFFEYIANWRDDNEPSCQTLVIAGDLFDKRDKISVKTIDYAIKAVESLRFNDVIMLKGNHDLHYRDRRDVCSLKIFEEYANVVDFYEISDDKIMYCSWILNQEEYDEIINVSKKKKVKAIIGHFEFSGFQLNDNYTMEHGASHKELRHVKKIFSGHYHKRQEKDNVVYIGTPFPYDFNDSNDLQRGFMIFDTETLDYDFENYEKISVLSMTHEEILDADLTDLENMSIRVVIEENIDDETLEKVKEKLEESEFRETKIVYKTNRIKDVLEEETDVGEVMSIDKMVITHLKDMGSVEGVDKDLLIELFQQTTGEE